MRKRLSRPLALQVFACAGWLGLLGFLIAIDSETNDGVVVLLLVLATIALGLIVGRWWVLAVPLIPFIVGTFANVISPSAGEDSPMGWEMIMFALLLVAEFLLAMPVAFMTILRRLH